ERLEAGGSTNGASGLQLAYDTARQGFITGGTNRVILCTDGDFNVGITNQDELVRLIEKEAKSGVFLSALGFGMGNYKDSTLEKLADKGNGNYGYIDNEREARKLFVEQMTGTLVTIAKDVKIQIEFNPARVGAFRLLGYENRILAHEDFNNDKKDAGEIGAGHTVTALYEVAPVGEDTGLPGVDPLKYQAKPRPAVAAAGNDDKTSNELLTVKLRYKEPEADNSQLIEKPLVDESKPWAAMGSDYKFAASVAAFGMLLRGSEHAGTATYATVLEWATEGKGADLQGYRGEFIDLVRKASTLQRE
ncbi:MAG TPA: YfbK domain-containing protein, partial [Pirellulales bacterium]|nr:YfbK domain-containing protein [Pirellulales bacterium]